ncbi:hypothetical protein LJR153_001307 [Paenibacillus sp. LjRoot153]|uniref:hypothetical protein n=1 Tax=Paenibacillus sp. LjRoot153 TaxID=3342270 RepID=UPI003ECC422D
MNLSDLHKHLPSLNNVTEISRITKGFSFDNKYFLYENSETPHYVLRTAPLKQMQKKQSEFNVVANVFDRGVRTSKPIQFGAIESPREVSTPFCRGQIRGYFNGTVPEEFWRLYALYTAMIIFGTVTWTLQVIPEQLQSMLGRIRIVLDDHQNFEKCIPKWFTS